MREIDYRYAKCRLEEFALLKAVFRLNNLDRSEVCGDIGK